MSMFLWAEVNTSARFFLPASALVFSPWLLLLSDVPFEFFRFLPIRFFGAEAVIGFPLLLFFDSSTSLGISEKCQLFDANKKSAVLVNSGAKFLLMRIVRGSRWR